MQSCEDCKGHALTHGRCHDKCKRHKEAQQARIKIKKDIKKAAGDAVAATRYSG